MSAIEELLARPRKTVESKNVSSIALDSAVGGDQTVIVEFKGGRVYAYYEVTDDDRADMDKAESVGSFVARVLRPKYRVESLE